MLIFSSIQHKTPSLADLAQDLATEFDIEITRSAIHQRFNDSTFRFLQEVFLKIQELPRFSIPPVSLQEHFSSLMIRDSSKCPLPNYFYKDYPSHRPNTPNEPGMLNIQFQVDLFSNRWVDLQFTRARRNDQTDSKESIPNLEPGSLNIRDLGYISLAYLNGVIKSGAYFLNRLPAKASVFDQNHTPIDWELLCKKVSKTKNNCLEVSVLIGVNDKIPMRLILSKVSDELAEKRIEEARKKAKRYKGKDYQVTDEFIARAKMSIIVTNVPQEVITKDQIWKTYSLRWQIELTFKAFKSEANIDKCHPMKTIRMQCHVMAKLIWAAISNYIRLAGEAYLSGGCENENSEALSLLKILKRVKNNAYLFRMFLRKKITPQQWIDKYIIPILQNSGLEVKSKKKNHRELLEMIGKTEVS